MSSLEQFLYQLRNRYSTEVKHLSIYRDLCMDGLFQDMTAVYLEYSSITVISFHWAIKNSVMLSSRLYP